MADKVAMRQGRWFHANPARPVCVDNGRRSHCLDCSMKTPSLRLDTPAYLPYGSAMLVDVLGREGVAADQVLRGTGLEAYALLRPATRLSIDQILAVCRNARALSHDPLLAVRAGLRMHTSACGIYGYALLSSRSHRDAQEFVSRYDVLLNPFLTMQFRLEEGWASWEMRVIDAVPRDAGLHAFLLEYKIAGMLTVMRSVYGANIRFDRVRLCGTPPPHAHALAHALECEVLYGCEVNDVRFVALGAQQRTVYADPIANATMRELCEQVMAGVARHGSSVDDVKTMLLRQPGQFPDMATMAEALRLNARTLQRKLEAEGSSYREVLAQVREGLAVQYLRSTRMTVEEISDRLGYSDAANFRQAFQRWTGASPGAFRRGEAGRVVAAVGDNPAP